MAATQSLSRDHRRLYGLADQTDAGNAIFIGFFSIKGESNSVCAAIEVYEGPDVTGIPKKIHMRSADGIEDLLVDLYRNFGLSVEEVDPDDLYILERH